MANAIVDWVAAKKCKMMISIGGMAIQDRQDLDRPKVFAAVSSDSMIKSMSEKGIELLSEGYVVGPYAVMLRRCAEVSIPAVTLLAQSFYNYPDPEAAAAAITELSRRRLVGFRVYFCSRLEPNVMVSMQSKSRVSVFLA